MANDDLFRNGSSVYFVGIKGTGVCPLVELLLNAGMKIRGSDTADVFYTDAILKELNIPYFENFDAAHITKDIDIVIYSAAYSPVDTEKEKANPELKRALELGISILKYPDALGAWSAKFDSTGICGVHGKTTTTALAGIILRALKMPAQILVGSAVIDFGGRSTYTGGNKYFIAETCEYRRHFLSFHPRRIILTAVESDHQDYFPDYESIRDAFIEYCRLLPKGGQLIYCADDSGAGEVARNIEKEGLGIELIPYGYKAEGAFKILSYHTENERGIFSIAGFAGDFKIRIPGEHNALNTAAALALATAIVKTETGNSLTEDMLQAVKTALENFRGTKRRSEILGTAGGILFMDDYGHHPTAIKTTLAGIKSFFPSHRLIVSFMPHTYTRTSALIDDFGKAFKDADILFLHKIYSSARENYTGSIDEKTLYNKTAFYWTASGKNTDNALFYIEEPLDAFNPLCEILKPDDIFLTLGAGSNWPLGEKLFNHFTLTSKGENK